MPFENGRIINIIDLCQTNLYSDTVTIISALRVLNLNYIHRINFTHIYIF